MAERSTVTLAATVVLLGVQAVGVAAMAVVVALRGLAAHPARASGPTHGSTRLVAELAAVFFLVVAVFVGVLARGWWRRRAWVRTPTFLVELLSVPVGVSLVQGHVYGPGVALLLLAVLVVACAVGLVRAGEPR